MSPTRPTLLLVFLFAPAALGQAPILPPPLDIAGLPGRLVLVGGSKVPEAAFKRFFGLAGGETKGKLVHVTTDDSTLNPWKSLEFASIKLVSPTADSKACEPLDTATAVWFAGPVPPKDSPLGKKLHALFARGGVIGGLSVSAAVDLGFLPGFAAEAAPGIVGVNIKDNNAVVCVGRRMDAAGDSSATITLLAGAGKEKTESVVRNRQPSDLVQLRRAAANRASAEPFPPKTPPTPNVAKGTLVIVGGGGATQDIMDTFFEKAGGKDALVVCIPTASETDAVPDDPADAKFLRRWGGTNVKVLHTRDRKVADDPKFSEILLKAGGVWFGGGRHWRFVDSYEGTLTQKRFAEVLERGGVIGGSSAGASIQSEYMPRGHPLGNTIMAAEGYEHGFGYLPGVAVDQHFIARKRFNDLNGLIKQYPQYLGVGIDEATAFVVSGSTAKIMGKSKVSVFDASKDPKNPAVTELKAGDSFDLKSRKKIEP